MNEQLHRAPPPEYKDRTVALVVFGVVQILMGLFFLLPIALVLLAMAVAQKQGAAVDAGSMVLAIVPCVVFVVIGIWLGIGSILARRWARALTLVLTWILLISGIVTLVFLFLITEDEFRAMARDGKIPIGVAREMAFAIVGTAGCIHIVILGSFILFYRSKHVRATCELKDSRVRWTDGCPLPVLALSLMLVFGAFCSILWVTFCGAVTPWFGELVDGPTGVRLMLGNSLMLACLARGVYKLKKWAWLGTIVVMIFWSVSLFQTFSTWEGTRNLRELCEKTHFFGAQLKAIVSSGLLSYRDVPKVVGTYGVVYLAYVLFVGWYFFFSKTANRVA